MTDIVARLRDSAHPEYATTVIVSDTLREAADEIERLHAVIERLLTSNAGYVSERDELRADNEQLRESCIKIALDKDVMIERLRSLQLDPTSYETSIRERDAEIERLRAALQLIRDDAMSPPEGPRDLWIEEIASRALEPKP